MIELPVITENRFIHAAQDAGQNPAKFLDFLLDEYYEELADVARAEAAMKEEGGITLQEFRAKHGV